MNVARRVWDHPYCERFFRLASLALMIGILVHSWFVGGLSKTAVLFLVVVVGLPVLALMVMIRANSLTRASIRRSWGWVVGIDEESRR